MSPKLQQSPDLLAIKQEQGSPEQVSELARSGGITIIQEQGQTTNAVGSSKRRHETTTTREQIAPHKTISLYQNQPRPKSHHHHHSDQTNVIMKIDTDNITPASSSFSLIGACDRLDDDNPGVSCATTSQIQPPDLERGDEDTSSESDEEFDYEPVLTKVLNEKKLALARSPEVIKFLSNIPPPSTSSTR